MAINTPISCSCAMCGNPSRYFGKKTLAELRNVDVFDGEIKNLQQSSNSV